MASKFLRELDGRDTLSRRLRPAHLVALDLVDPSAKTQRFVMAILGVLGRCSDGSETRIGIRQSFDRRDLAIGLSDIPGVTRWLGKDACEAYCALPEGQPRRVRGIPLLRKSRCYIEGGLADLSVCALQCLRLPGIYADFDVQFLHDLLLYGLREAVAYAVEGCQPDPDTTAWLIEECSKVRVRYELHTHEISTLLASLRPAPGELPKLYRHTLLVYGYDENDPQIRGQLSFDRLGRPL